MPRENSTQKTVQKPQKILVSRFEKLYNQ